MHYEDLILEKEGGIGILTLNRPEKRNALTLKMMTETIPQALEEVRKDDEIKVLILTGAGQDFCSGLDVSALAKTPAEAEASKARNAVRLTNSWRSTVLPLRSLNQVTIAAVNGVALGAGFTIALLCDIRIVSEDARFSMGFIRMGLIPGMGSTYLLPQQIGISKALELMVTGDMINAMEAEKLGLVNKVVPSGELEKEAKQLGERIAQGPPIAIELTKRSVYKSIYNDIEQQMEFEGFAQDICINTEDFKESLTAFREKRKPVFKGR